VGADMPERRCLASHIPQVDCRTFDSPQLASHRQIFLLYKAHRLIVLAGQCVRLLALTGTTLLFFLATQQPQVTDPYRPFLRS